MGLDYKKKYLKYKNKYLEAKKIYGGGDPAPVGVPSVSVASESKLHEGIDEIMKKMKVLPLLTVAEVNDVLSECKNSTDPQKIGENIKAALEKQAEAHALEKADLEGQLAQKNSPGEVSPVPFDPLDKIEELKKVPQKNLVEEELNKMNAKEVEQILNALIEQTIEKTIDAKKEVTKVDLEAKKEVVLGITVEDEKDKAVKELIKYLIFLPAAFYSEP